MRSSLPIVVLLPACALLTSALALPSAGDDSTKRAGSFSLPLRRSPSSASVPVTFHQPHGRWYTEFTIGGQPLTLEIDTGSAELWVYGPKAPNDGSHRVYDPTKSGTPVQGNTFSTQYMTGSGASGNVVKDTVTFGAVSVPGVAIGVADTIGPGIYPDGMIGLGFRSPSSPNKDPSFIEAAQSYLDHPLFTVDLGNPSNAVMSLGVVDRSRYSGSLTMVQASQCSSGWCLDDITFSVNGVPMGFTQKRMAADTGGDTIMTVAPFVAQTYYAQVAGSTRNSGEQNSGAQSNNARNSAQSVYWTAPCDAKFPELTLNIGGGSVVISGDKLQSQQRSRSGALQCVCNLQESRSNKGGGNLADPFFLSQFVVFHITDKTISFAPFA